MADLTLYLQFIMVLFAFFNGGKHGKVEAIRMKHPPIKLNSDILMVGVPAKLTCNYVRMRSEDIRDITWYAGYNGISMKIFEYKVGQNTKRDQRHHWIRVDNDTATEEELTITLTELREKKMKFKCEVQARLEQHGRVKLNTKHGEVEFDVADTNSHRLILKPGRPTASLHGMGAARTATVGEQLIVSCMTFGATKAPNLTLHVNNQKLIRGGPIRGGRVDVEPVRVAGSGSNNQGTALVGYIDTVYDNMFRYGNNKMTIECKAWYGDQIFEKESMELTKETGRNHQNQNHQNPPTYSSNPRSRDPRTFNGDFERHAEVVHSHLLEMMDPARHMHPGIPYDFYSGYVVVEAQNLEEQGGNSGYSRNAIQDKTVVLGKLPHDVRAALEAKYGKYEYVNDNKVNMKMDAVSVLNLLGELNYRIIGTSSSDKKDLTIWTLEHKDFEKLKRMPQNDINHSDHGF